MTHSLTDIAERAKTSTEAQVRARVTWETLQTLCVAYTTAKKNYLAMQMMNGNPNVYTPDELIRKDLAYNIAQQAFYAANDAYQSALKRYQEQQS